MAFAKKGSRQITVDGTAYRFIGRFCERDRAPSREVNEFRVQLAHDPGSVLRAEFGYARLKAEYARVGQHVSRWIDSVPPYVVRQAVRLARARGWTPENGDAGFDLACIDDQIDWSLLTPQVPTKKKNAGDS